MLEMKTLVSGAHMLETELSEMEIRYVTCPLGEVTTQDNRAKDLRINTYQTSCVSAKSRVIMSQIWFTDDTDGGEKVCSADFF